MLCRHPTAVNLSTGGENKAARAEIVSSSYFSVLRVRPHLGRLIGPADDQQPDAHPVIVLSHDYWMTRLGGAADVIGHRVFLNNHPMTVIGVAPATFRHRCSGHAHRVDPCHDEAAGDARVGRSGLAADVLVHAIGRLRPGVSAEQAHARLQPWFTQSCRPTFSTKTFRPSAPRSAPASLRRPSTSSPRHAVSRPARRFGTAIARAHVRRRAPARSGVAQRGGSAAGARDCAGAEFATRMALGASRGRVVRQLLVESVLITAGGGALGVAIAPLWRACCGRSCPRARTVTAGIDQRVLIFAFAASVVTGAVCSVAPAFQLRRLHLSAAMSERSAATGRAGVRVRKCWSRVRSPSHWFCW